MAMNKPALYRLSSTLIDHSHSVNAMSFSPDGLMLATGGDDGLLLVYCLSVTTNTWTLRFRFQAIGAITCIIWNPRFEAILVVGNRNGDIHVIRLSRVWNPWSAAYRRSSIVWRLSRRSSIQCLAVNRKGTIIAIGHGTSVSLMKQGTPSAFDDISVIPDPPAFPEVEGTLPRPVARSLHFVDDEDIIIVTYLQHGIACVGLERPHAWIALADKASHVSNVRIITHHSETWLIRASGASSLSPDGATLVVTNLYDGLDYYSVPNRRWVNTTIHSIGENLCVPVEHIHEGSDILFGGTMGCARILRKANAETIAVLEHDDELVQTIAYCRRKPNAWWGRGFADQIATAVSECGSHTEVRVWSGSEDPRDTFGKALAEALSKFKTLVPSKRDLAVTTFAIAAAASVAVLTPQNRTSTALHWLLDILQRIVQVVMEPFIRAFHTLGGGLTHVENFAEFDHFPYDGEVPLDGWFSQWSSAHEFLPTPTGSLTSQTSVVAAASRIVI